MPVCPTWLAAVVWCVTLASQSLPLVAQEEPKHHLHGAVAADHPLASAAGVEVLRNGGNVIDAAVATAMVLSVVRPESSGLGGGGFLIHWNAATQTATAWDYRERAPLSATAGMFVQAAAEGRKLASQCGMLSVAVPGQIPGLCEIHRQAGRLSLKVVLAPAMRHATSGVPVDEQTISTQRDLLTKFARQPELRNTYQALWSGYLNSGTEWRAGELFRSPQKAALQMLSEHGLNAFLDGPIGAALVEQSVALGGLVTRADLGQMAPVNAFGLQQSAANAIAPRKKPLSSMTPTIVLKDGRAVAIAGASGGPRIITATLQVLLLMLEFDRGAQAAVSAPRLHHQWQPDEVLLEKGTLNLEAALAGKGHRVRATSSIAATQALRWTTHGLEPGSDPRKHGVPAGY